MTFLACLGAGWLCLIAFYSVKYVRAELKKRRVLAEIAATPPGQPIGALAHTEAASPHEQAMRERMRFEVECSEWNRLVTSTPPIRFQPVNYPETRQ